MLGAASDGGDVTQTHAADRRTASVPHRAASPDPTPAMPTHRELAGFDISARRRRVRTHRRGHGSRRTSAVPRHVTSGRDDWPLALAWADAAVTSCSRTTGTSSIIVIVLYRTLYKVFGLRHVRAVAHRGLACLDRRSRFAVSSSLRTKIGPVHRRLWSRSTSSGSRTRSSCPHARSNYLVLVGADRVRLGTHASVRHASDITVAAALAFALCAAGGGVTVAAACGVYAAVHTRDSASLARDPRSERTWLAWWVKYARDVPSRDPSFARLPADAAHRLRRRPRVVRRRWCSATAISARALRRSRSSSTSAGGSAPGCRPRRTRSRGRCALIVWWAGLVYDRGALARSLRVPLPRWSVPSSSCSPSIPPHRSRSRPGGVHPLRRSALVVVAGLYRAGEPRRDRRCGRTRYGRSRRYDKAAS